MVDRKYPDELCNDLAQVIQPVLGHGAVQSVITMVHPPVAPPPKGISEAAFVTCHAVAIVGVSTIPIGFELVAGIPVFRLEAVHDPATADAALPVPGLKS